MSVQAQTLKTNKFEENAIRKQEESYKVSFAKKCFSYSCEMCSTRNLRPTGTCANCPIKEAHVRALARIAAEGEPNSLKGCQVSKFKNKRTGSVHITLVMHYD